MFKAIQQIYIYSAYQRKEETLGFPTMYQNNKSNEK